MYFVNYFVTEENRLLSSNNTGKEKIALIKIITAPFCSADFPPLLFCVQEVERDLQTKREGISEAIRSVEELLADKGESLSPEERANLEGALTKMKEQYNALTDSVNTSLSEVHAAIDATLQQNTQKVSEFFQYKTPFLCNRVATPPPYNLSSSFFRPRQRRSSMRPKVRLTLYFASCPH